MLAINKIETESNKEEKTSNILENYMSDMYRVAKSRLLSEEDIYDAIQEASYKLYINIDKIHDKNKIKIWLIKVLINECNKIYRNKKKRDKTTGKSNRRITRYD